jgi:phage shock protein C
MSNTRAPLRRSRRNRIVAGVCGGLGEFFALIPGGVPGLAVYLLFWFIVPKASD